MAPSQQASASSTATAEAATSFHKFSELPKELRLTIWELALPGPRITLKMAHLKQNRCPRVRSDANIDTNQFFDVIPQDTYGGGSHGGFYHRGFRSGCPSPALFYVCKDSFSVASKRYERVFGSIHKIPDTWFDFSRDSLYCDWGSLVFLLQYLDPLELERVQSLVLDWMDTRLLLQTSFTSAVNQRVFCQRTNRGGLPNSSSSFPVSKTSLSPKETKRAWRIEMRNFRSATTRP